VLSSSTICKDHVKNAAGEDLGKIENLMIDLHSGRIAFAGSVVWRLSQDG
jgi:sporulation protein YlmC with PRC-barrel domain